MLFHNYFKPNIFVQDPYLFCYKKLNWLSINLFVDDPFHFYFLQQNFIQTIVRALIHTNINLQRHIFYLLQPGCWCGPYTDQSTSAFGCPWWLSGTSPTCWSRGAPSAGAPSSPCAFSGRRTSGGRERSSATPHLSRRRSSCGRGSQLATSHNR
mgnify:CR=1 FL=1